MRFSATTILNFTAVSGVITLMFTAMQGSNHFSNGADGVDTMTTASVTAHSQAQPFQFADQFTVFDYSSGGSCVIRLHRDAGYDVHRIEPGKKCESISSELAKARTWQENANGLVNVTDYKGNNLMQLVRGDGLAWEVIQPAHLNIALEAF